MHQLALDQNWEGEETTMSGGPSVLSLCKVHTPLKEVRLITQGSEKSSGSVSGSIQTLLELLNQYMRWIS